MAFKGDNFKDRATAAAEARKKLAEKFKAMKQIYGQKPVV